MTSLALGNSLLIMLKGHRTPPLPSRTQQVLQIQQQNTSFVRVLAEKHFLRLQCCLAKVWSGLGTGQTE